MLQVKIFTLYPDLFPGPLDIGIFKKAKQNKIWNLRVINIRDYSKDNHGTVDDTPFGGGSGMLLRPDILASALDKNIKKGEKIIYLSPRGKKFDQEFAKKLSQEKGAVFICGRYEGVDERFLIHNEIEEVSVGDFVLSGGEIGAQLIMDATIRLIPDVIGNAAGLMDESFERHLLEYPLYTHPRVWKDMEVPEVLLSGNHKKIQMWKLKMSEKLTKFRRPDLWSKYIKS